MLPLIGLAHLVVVVSVLSIGLRGKELDWITKLNAMVVGIWTNLVITGLLLSTISSLDHPVLYAGLSIIIALPIGVLLSRLKRQSRPASQLIPGILDGPGFLSRSLIVFMLISGVAVIGANMLLVIGYIPNNSDSLSYRIPRIYWYFSSGQLGHFANGIDPRAIYYPFDGTLLYLPIVQYRWSLRLFTLIPFCAWSVVGLTVFRIAREVGFSRQTGLAAAWLTCLTPGVLVEATSTNDEIIAAFILLIGIYFALRSYRRLSLPDAAMAMLAGSLSLGTKLHMIFFWPIFVAGSILSIYRVVTGRSLSGRHLFTLPVATQLISILWICAALILPFAWFNWQASGHLMDQGFSAQILNSPFQWTVGLQNLILHASQTILSPLPDLNLSSDTATRTTFYTTYDDWLSGLFKWVDQGPAFMSAGYRFNGATQSSGWQLDENGVDIGWSFLLIAASLLTSRNKPDIHRFGFSNAISFILWFSTYCFMTKYIEGFSVYLTYGFIVCASLVPFSLARTRGWITPFCIVVLCAVTTTHSIAALNILRYNIKRNVPTVLAAETWPLDPPLVDEPIASAIRRYGGAQFQATHWEVPYWSFMALDKAGRYYVDHPSRPNADRLNIFPCQISQAYGCLPVQILGKTSPGLSKLGTFSSDYGLEWAFAGGSGIAQDAAYPSGYILLQLYDNPASGHVPGRDLTISSSVAGFDPLDNLQFRYSVRMPDGILIETDWGDPGRLLYRPTIQAGGVLLVDVRIRGNPDVMKHVEYRLQNSEPFELNDGASR